MRDQLRQRVRLALRRKDVARWDVSEEPDRWMCPWHRSGDLLALVLRIENRTYQWPESLLELPDDLHVGWVILEGGPGPMHPQQPRVIRDWCEKHAVPFCFLSWGDWCPADQVDPDWYNDVLNRERQPKWQEAHFVEGLLCYTTCWLVGKRCSGRWLDDRRFEAFPERLRVIDRKVS